MSPGPGRILVVKLSAMGDIIHATPCLRALRTTFPAANIALAVEERWAAVARHNPFVDRLIATTSDTRLTPRYLWRVRRTLSNAGPFDLAIDLQGTRRSAAWVYLSGARVRAGRGWPRPGWRPAIRPDLTDHAVNVCADICARVGATVTDRSPFIVTDGKDEADLDAILAAAGLPNTDLVVAHPFTRWPSKNWPVAQAARVLPQIAREVGRPVVIAGGTDDVTRVRQLLARVTRDDVASLAGALTLGQSLCLYRRARVLISCDTGPMHAAAAFGTPVVALFGPTHPERTGPWGSQHIVLQASRPRHHHAYRTAAGVRHMHALNDDAIVRAVSRQLGERRA